MITQVAPFYGRLLGPIYEAETEWYNTQLNPYTYDPVLANKYFGDAGFGYDAQSTGALLGRSRSDLNVIISYNQGNDIRERVAYAAKDQVEAYGISVVIQSPEWSTYLSEQIYSHEYDICILGITGGAGDPIGYFSDVLGTDIIEGADNMPIGIEASTDPLQGPGAWIWSGTEEKRMLNFWSYWNPQVDALTLQAQREPSETVQKILCDQLQEILVEDNPAIYLYAVNTVLAVQAKWAGFLDGSPWSTYVGGQRFGYTDVWDSSLEPTGTTAPQTGTTAPPLTTTAPVETTAPTETTALPPAPSPAIPGLFVFVTLAALGVGLTLLRRRK
jgi:ABC-type transport system substrate-binding protein